MWGVEWEVWGLLFEVLGGDEGLDVGGFVVGELWGMFVVVVVLIRGEMVVDSFIVRCFQID